MRGRNVYDHERDSASAAGVARAISRALRKGGFQMANTSGKSWTVGFYVGRVGVSNWVSVDWRSADTAAGRDESRVMRIMAREHLAHLGYALDDRLWLEVRARKVK